MTDSQHASPQRSPRSRRWLFRCAALVLGVLISLVAVEVVLRVVGRKLGNSPSVGHPVYHHWYPSDYEFFVWTPLGEYGGFNVRYNSEGFAMDEELPPPDEPTILIAGDSFTAAREVPGEERFTELVAAQLQTTVLNFGCSSFSPLLTRLLLDHYAERIEPKAICLQLYSNDVNDDVQYEALAERDAEGRVVRVPGDRTPWWTRLANRSYLARLVRTAWVAWKFERTMREKSDGAWSPDDWSPYFSKPLDEWYEADKLALIESNLLDIQAICRERDIPFVLFAIPDRGALLHGTPDYFNDYFQAFARRHVIDYLDLVPEFQSHEASELFYQVDIHLTPAGHQLVGRALAQHLDQLLAKPAEQPADQPSEAVTRAEPEASIP